MKLHNVKLVPLAAELDRGLAVVSLRGPLSLGGRMRAWYHLQQTPDGFQMDPAEIIESDKLLIEAVAELAAERGKLLLLGFSQGAGMAIRAALLQPQLVAGLVSLSGVPPLAAELQPAPPEALRGLPAFVAHGVHDPLLPIEAGHAIRDILTEAGLAVTYREYQMGHMIVPDELEDLRAWLPSVRA